MTQPLRPRVLHRWDPAPVLDELRRRLGVYHRDDNPFGFSAANAAVILGVPADTIGRWARGEATMSDEAADRAAIRLGYWPAGLWPDWYDVGLNELDHLDLEPVAVSAA